MKRQQLNNLEQIKIYIAQRQWEEAEESLKALDTVGKSSAESQYLLGTIYHRKNQLNDAVQAFQRSLLMDPNFTDSAISLSVIYNDTGHYQEAKSVFEQAENSLKKNSESSSHSIVLDKELARKHMELGILYQKLQRFDSATHEFLKASRLDPNNLNTKILLAKTQAQRGQTEAAQKELEAIIQTNPYFIPARLHLALLYYSRGNTVDARMELSQALLYDPQNKAIRMYLAMTEKATESTLPTIN